MDALSPLIRNASIASSYVCYRDSVTGPSRRRSRLCLRILSSSNTTTAHYSVPHRRSGATALHAVGVRDSVIIHIRRLASASAFSLYALIDPVATHDAYRKVELS